MSSRLYGAFCELLETLPVKAVVRAADAERRMVQDDLKYKRTASDEESMSVLEFCTFLVNAARGFQASLPVWPAEHIAFYRAIVKRLINAGELPSDVGEWFEKDCRISRPAESR